MKYMVVVGMAMVASGGFSQGKGQEAEQQQTLPLF